MIIPVREISESLESFRIFLELWQKVGTLKSRFNRSTDSHLVYLLEKRTNFPCWSFWSIRLDQDNFPGLARRQELTARRVSGLILPTRSPNFSKFCRNPAAPSMKLGMSLATILLWKSSINVTTTVALQNWAECSRIQKLSPSSVSICGRAPGRHETEKKR